MNEIQDSLLNTMKQFSDYSIQNDKAPLTIDCDITRVVDEKQGIYEVLYLGNKFNVYSERGTIYLPEDKVYVIVPEGDFTKQKFIIGLYQGEYIQPKDTSAIEKGGIRFVTDPYISPISANGYLYWEYANNIVQVSLQDGCVKEGDGWGPYSGQYLPQFYGELSQYDTIDEYSGGDGSCYWRSYQPLGYIPYPPDITTVIQSNDTTLSSEYNYYGLRYPMYLVIDTWGKIFLYRDNNQRRLDSYNNYVYSLQGTYISSKSPKIMAPSNNAYDWGGPGILFDKEKYKNSEFYIDLEDNL